MKEHKRRLAIIDMNNNAPNQGLRCIKDIVSNYEDFLEWDVFDARGRNEVPDMSYDIYISSGGPGSPLEKGAWKNQFLDLLDRIWKYNQNEVLTKKYFFFICYSFQVACEYFELAEVTKRRTTSFGILPIHKTIEGLKDPLLEGLQNPYYAVDSRDWQIIQPQLDVFKEHGASILSIERIRTHHELERAIMAVRFSDEFVGTQFHPEADPQGMAEHFAKKENREKVINNFDESIYNEMMQHVNDPAKLDATYQRILPHFITSALDQIHIPSLIEAN